MDQKKVCVIGHFGFGENLLNGQTVKTKILCAELERVFGTQQVYKIDTHGGIKALVKLPFQTFGAMRQCDNVVILPAHNGLRVVAPLLSLYRVFFKRKLHYAVVGGWLPKYLKAKKCLTKQLKKFTGIYVETNTMKKALGEMGFENVVVMPNCKDLQILEISQLPEVTKPYRLCTFSRVMKEKGMEDAITAVRAINEAAGETVYTLDIYGPVDPAQTQWFEALKEAFPEYVRYGGAVPFDKSVEVLKDYFALLFPTRFYTEGIPGTVIDAYAAGVPVVSAKWESFSDMISEGVTGYGYAFGKADELTGRLIEMEKEPERITGLKKNCLERAQEFTPERAVEVLIRNMEDT